MKNIYFDHNATTKIRVEVKHLINSMMDDYLNPSSVHNHGRFAKSIIENSRNKILELLSLSYRQYDVIFTSSGTESNNLIINNFNDADIFISNIEHLSIFAYNNAANVKIISVDENGLLNLSHLEELLKNSNNSKKLVSVMLANNETGVIQNMKAISDISHKFAAILHSDIIQAICRINIDISDLMIDIATISSHKIGGAFGTSAIIAKSNIITKSMIIGGGQEKNIRSGTENIISIATLSKAFELGMGAQTEYFYKTRILQQKLENSLSKYSNISILSNKANRLPNTSLIIIPGSDSQEKLIGFDLRNIAISSGSACSSGKIGKSHVVEAIIGKNYNGSGIRVSFNIDNNLEEVEFFIKSFKEIYNIYD
jgi:cysteine desulfurase